VTYRCNSKSDTVHIHGWFPHTTGVGLFARDDMPRMMSILSAYTGRQLTYESDALAAVVSALTTFSHGAVRHIWGLPVRFRSSGDDYTNWDAAELALFWRHETFCLRRAAFPSWSPIAWTGSADWYLETTAPSHGIRCVNIDGSSYMSPWAWSDTNDEAEDPPRYLEITAKMTRLRLVRNLPPVRCGSALSQQTYMAFRLDNDVEIILHRPFWDTDPSALDEEDEIRGVLFDTAVRNAKFIALESPIVMLVKRCGKHYERVGIIRLENVLQECFGLVVHEARYLRFYDRCEDRFWQHDLGDLEHMNGIDAKDVRFPLWKESEWEEYFATDTIVLG